MIAKVLSKVSFTTKICLNHFGRWANRHVNDEQLSFFWSEQRAVVTLRLNNSFEVNNSWLLILCILWCYGHHHYYPIQCIPLINIVMLASYVGNLKRLENIQYTTCHNTSDTWKKEKLIYVKSRSLKWTSKGKRFCFWTII